LAKRTKSALKQARKAQTRRLQNRDRRLVLKDALRKIREAKTKEEAKKLFTSVQATIDRSARHHIIHTNTARRLKARLSRDISLMR
jgi:small subunit ribosomal protein S20